MQSTGSGGGVVAWSFGLHAEVLGGPEFELEVPVLGRDVPSLIGLSSSYCQEIDGKQRFLHPVVTCLAGTGETFNAPLLLRFPVGHVDSMESGSDCGSHDDAEMIYCDYLKSTFSVVSREDGSSEWVPIDGVIKQANGGVFVLEVAVSHFCDFALEREFKVDPGMVDLFSLPSLQHKSRRSHFHFMYQGTEDLVVHCWGAPRKKPGFFESFRMKLGIRLTGGDAEFEANRPTGDVPGTGVYMVDVPGGPVGQCRSMACLVVDGFKSLTIAYTTQETIRPLIGSSFEQVQVWRSRPMTHKQAMVIGPLVGRPQVINLKVEDGDDVGEVVRSSLKTQSGQR
ncbi:unnamed protein product [Hapterophycus canaliculatus]